MYQNMTKDELINCIDAALKQLEFELKMVEDGEYSSHLAARKEGAIDALYALKHAMQNN